ncbi:DMT family transporter [Sulfitobacter donghicola]|uniref:Membrane protein n=1 Tax=Sulfitobacter donghicola DSW-25 = KCTC 12864 = JCM 14565 TaxID=1300350 RepID=A0A073IJR8_9RHOB|nr:DMT family transporter [Sulfitobacter donghicola]KEJ89999.1 membrane protein [Sulfitobacter donghicola DSW-25 = KCTC 12864 = JCM 14565]KIN66872.1 putative integral membrane protein [Sulfitobacter donghicola DSW-25 = KCTC 12864 = JCM 14565]
MNDDRPVLGILLMLGFCILAPLGDSIAKILGATIPLGQLVLTRFAVQAALLIPVIMFAGLKWRLPPDVLALATLRTVLHILGIGFMFTSLLYLPLADAVAIAFVMPFIMLLLGRFVLNEEVGMHRLIACAVGFIGTLLVIQPNFLAVGWVALLPVAVAVIFALFMLTTRQIAKKVDPIALQGVSGCIATVILLPFLAIGCAIDFAPLSVVTPNPTEWLLLAAIGILGTLAHLVMTWSLRFAPSATLAPMQYLEIPMATVVGFWLFSELPNRMAAIGIVITVMAGVYVIFREQANARRLAKIAPPAA